MNYYDEELEEIKSRKKLIYRPPLSRKKQRVTIRASKRSPVKIYTKEEIQQFTSVRR
jgi:hypothetical protein